MATLATPVGTTGLVHYGGQIHEELLAELSGTRWHRVVREMTEQDATIGGILFAIQMLIRQTAWSVAPYSDDDPADIEVSSFVGECLHDMRESWALTLSEIMSFLPWGYAPLETTYKQRRGLVARNSGEQDLLRSSKFDDGKIGWASWSIRAQETVDRWEFDEQGDPVALIQVAPPDFVPRRIPMAKLLHFRATARKGNPEGWSILRNAYRSWYFKKKIENIEGIGIERDLAGLPVAYVPPELLSSERSAAETAIYNAIERIVTNIRRDDQEGIVWPAGRDENGNLLYELKLLTTGGTRQFDTNKIIERYDSRIAMSVLADFILIGHQQTGSYSLVSSKTTLFATALGAWLDTICSVINSMAIPTLLRLNGLDPSRAPTLTHGDVESVDLGTLGPYLESLVKASPLFAGPDGDRIFRHALAQAGLPAPSEQAAQEADAEDTPPDDQQPPEDDQPAQAAEGDGFAPPQAVRDAAARGLALRAEHGRGGTAIGVARARDLSNGKNISLDTIGRMRSYFARHEVDKQGQGWDEGTPGYPSAGRVAWLLWGGDPGRAWANRIYEQQRAAEAPAVDLDALLDAAFDDARQWAAQATGG